MDTLSLLDPDIFQTWAATPRSQYSTETLAEIRSRETPPIELRDDVERTDFILPGDPDVVVRIYRPKGASGALPCIYHIHGGGYVFGTYEMGDAWFDEWCPMFGCMGASVEYRLAPETSYPGPLDDCYAGLQWLFEQSAELGIDPGGIGIAGISAGSGLVAGLALLARAIVEIPLVFQLLDSPMLDDRQITPSSRLADLPVWNRDANEFGWRSYLGDLYGTETVPVYAAAARATDLSGLPPTFVSVGSVDGFRDEDIDYAVRLNQAGVPTELHVYAGAPHGMRMYVDTAVTQQSFRDQEDWIRRQLARLRARADA